MCATHLKVAQSNIDTGPTVMELESSVSSASVKAEEANVSFIAALYVFCGNKSSFTF